jgi:hypothetical protein
MEAEIFAGVSRRIKPKPVTTRPKPNHSKVFWFFFSKKNRKKARLF